MSLNRYAEKWTMIVLPLASLAVAVLTIIYTEATGKPSSDMLFSGQGLSSHQGDGLRPDPEGNGPDGERRYMGELVGFQEALRRLATIDESFVEDVAGLGTALDGMSALDPKTAALVWLGASLAIGSPAVCLKWSATRALAAGATEDEIADVLLAVAPVVGLGRVVCTAPDVAIALGYDVAAALEQPDDR